MLSYVGLDYRFDFEPLINDVLKKKFVFIGFSAWLLLIPLAITSSDKMVRLLKQNWKKLHRLVYVISIFGVLHFIWLSKTIFFKPLIFLIILIILLLFRINFSKSVLKSETLSKSLNDLALLILINFVLFLSLLTINFAPNLPLIFLNFFIIEISKPIGLPTLFLNFKAHVLNNFLI